MAEGTQRRLAAIVAIDVVGYSRLMGADEDGTLAALKGHREAVTLIIQSHGGRIVGTAGDGLLLEFASVVEAVTAAIETQALMAERNADVPDDQKMIFRVGVNLGDVLADTDGDIYGDGVNVAARIEALAEPGGICISRMVRDGIRDRTDLVFDDMGEIEVKNIARPVRVFRVLAEGKAVPAPARKSPSKSLIAVVAAVALLLALVGGGVWWGWQQPRNQPADPAEIASNFREKPSIAVLPFVNISGDKEQEYFADGMTDDLITDLSKLSGLIVIARNSVFTYKGKNVKVQEVAKDLNVSHVLEGSVRRAGGQVRINAQLIDARTGDHLWAERFDRLYKDIFALQDEVIAKIIDALKVKLRSNEEARLHSSRRVDPDAYDMLLRGLAELRRYSRDSFVDARAYFEQAAAIDPGYARAISNVAFTYVMEVFSGYSDDPKVALDRAEALIDKAVGLDDTLPQVYFARSSLLRIRRQHDRALADIQKAIELAPNLADGYAAEALTLIYIGRAKEALKAIQTAMRLNPHNTFFYHYSLGLAYFHLEQYKEAVTAFEKVIERNPQFLRGHLLLAATYGQMGRIEDAEWEAEEVMNLLPSVTLRQREEIAPYKRKIDIDRYIEGLRKAGLPE